MKTLLKSFKNIFLTISRGSGQSRPLITSAKIEKITKNHEKSDFSKINNFLYSGREYDIWPEIGLLGPGKHSETLY